eukprot:TRINITY_DN834_c1_g1_i1.p1 TRINITY_DN834_c1_g1~~TRINITY_DN834_c1_g1_i1.p1  ORF type:complete len:670 (+),score=171.48 TRINITY_DN834_c1_g1_i1:46-2010(+)
MEGYRLLQQIGKGKASQGVMLMEHEQEGSMCVMKRVDLALLPGEEQKKAVQECELLMALRHPNIVKYKESISTGRCQYTVMEYCKGGSLEQLIATRRKLGSGPFEEPQVLRWIAQLATALEYCHKKHVLHRDIKAANCFLSSDHNDILLGDFGIAKVLSHTMSVAQTIIGSPCNMSPEVIEGKAYNQASDVWSLGCLLYEMCALRKPFGSHNLNQLVKQVTVDKPPAAPKHTSPLVQNLLKMLLEKDPSQRASLKQILAIPELQTALTGGNRKNGSVLDAPVANGNGPDNSHLSMDDWLVQHYKSLNNIRSYLDSMKKPDEQYVRAQLNEAKPKTPDMRQDRVQHRTASSPNRHSSPNPPKRKQRLSQPVAADPPMNPRQAREQREAELEQKRAKLALERDARRMREKLNEEHNEAARRQNAENRKVAANQRQEFLGQKPAGGGHHYAKPCKDRNQPPPLTQQQKEHAALEEKKRRILQEREDRKTREMKANEKAEEGRRQNAEVRRKATEARRLNKDNKERPGLASTYKGPSAQINEDEAVKSASRNREGYYGGGGDDSLKKGARLRAKSEPARVPSAPVGMAAAAAAAGGKDCGKEVVAAVPDIAMEDRREQRRLAQDQFRQKIAADRQRAMKVNVGQPDVEICLPPHLLGK